MVTKQQTRLVGAKEAGPRLGMHPKTFVRECREGRIPASYIGGKWLVSEEWIERLENGETVHDSTAATTYDVKRGTGRPKARARRVRAGVDPFSPSTDPEGRK